MFFSIIVFLGNFQLFLKRLKYSFKVYNSDGNAQDDQRNGEISSLCSDIILVRDKIEQEIQSFTSSMEKLLPMKYIPYNFERTKKAVYKIFLHRIDIKKMWSKKNLMKL